MERITKLGWFVVELALVLVVLCVLLHILLGEAGGSVITGVAANTQAFLQAVPPGSFLGIVLIVLLYWMFRARRPS